tara:strand:- start:98 stop:544 length:447 start_codon:yes stop_codon:yes gene_type:complete
MKISKRQLRKIIREERRRLLEGARSPEMAALESAVEALAAVDGWEEVADVLAGISDEIATGQYKNSGGSGEPMTITDKILAAFDKVGLAYTDHMSQDNEIFIDVEGYNPYSDEVDKIEAIVRKLPGVVEIYEGDDGMVVEVDWDKVGY